MYRKTAKSQLDETYGKRSRINAGIGEERRLINAIRKGQMNWTGDTTRRFTSKIVLEDRIEGKKAVGKPRMTSDVRLLGLVEGQREWNYFVNTRKSRERLQRRDECRHWNRGPV